MDSKREAEVLRAVVKKMMSVEGLRFDRNHTLRNIGRRVVEFNEQTNIGDPITVTEFCKLYLDIMQELVAEHFALIEKKIAEARLDNEHFRDDPR